MIKNITTSKVAIIALVSGLTACGEMPSQSANDDEALAASSQNAKPDFSQITDVNQKKAAFFDFLRPAVEHENQRVDKERQFLESIKSTVSVGKPLSGDQRTYADKLADKYKVALNDQGVTAEWLSAMLERVDVLPESLVLSQAANESGWGTSRFAVEGNNYFGQWCYRKGCGLVPNARNEGASHEVAVFASPYLSVQAYFMNVNTNRAYQDLRDIRAAQRVAGEVIEGTKLAEGLSRYSERGQAYVDEIQAMIRHNNQYWRQG